VRSVSSFWKKSRRSDRVTEIILPGINDEAQQEESCALFDCAAKAFNIRNDYWSPARKVDFSIARASRELGLNWVRIHRWIARANQCRVRAVQLCLSHKRQHLCTVFTQDGERWIGQLSAMHRQL